jgi:hypothetical protein
MMLHLWDHYWSWVGGNVGAMPLQAAITVAATLLLRKPIKKAWRRAVGERADIEDIRRAAAAAHKIAADLFEHHTGSAHQDAPDNESEAK